MVLKGRYVIGIDEAGRGALAGPVAVSAVLAQKGLRLRIKRVKLDDSKKMNAGRREIWHGFLKNYSKKNPKSLSYSVSFVSNSVVDLKNISKAADLAAGRALLKVLRKNRRINPSNTVIYVDAGLSLPREITLVFKIRQFPGADGRINAVKMASILAKVERDRKMEKFGRKFPRYGFLRHKGYGTKHHRRAISKYGACKIHRRTFLGKCK